jgi:predicted transposase/invertase (TIGR01784 family)
MTEKWAYFFKNADTSSLEDRAKLKKDDGIIDKAYEQLDRVSWNDTELLSYDQAEKYEGAYMASMAQKFDEGKMEGKIEGKIEGKLEGKIEIARDLIRKKYDVKMISDITGLSLDQINTLE